MCNALRQIELAKISLPDAGNWNVVIPLFDLDHNAGTVARIGMINRQVESWTSARDIYSGLLCYYDRFSRPRYYFDVSHALVCTGCCSPKPRRCVVSMHERDAHEQKRHMCLEHFSSVESVVHMKFWILRTCRRFHFDVLVIFLRLAVQCKAWSAGDKRRTKLVGER